MGSPVFAVKDILNVEVVEEEALASMPCTSTIWNRYVDDVSHQSLFRTVIRFVL